MDSLVVAVRDKDAQAQIREDLENDSGLSGARIEFVGDINSLMQRLFGEPVDLLVIDYDFAWVSDSSGQDQVSQAIALAENFENTRDTLILILGPVSSSDDEYKLARLGKVEVIKASSMYDLVGEQKQPLHVATALAMLENRQNSAGEADNSPGSTEPPAGAEPPGKPTGLLELRIDPEDMVTVSARLIYADKKTLDLPPKNFIFDNKQKQLLEFFETILEDKKVDTKLFLNTLKQVGKTTRDILNYDDDTKFSVMELLKETGGVENIWIRFSISNKDMAPIPFESIFRCDRYKNEDRKSEFHFNYSPVYRVVDSHVPGGGEPRFPVLSGLHRSSSEKFKCLIIDASTSGAIEKGDYGELPVDLPKIEDEAEVEIGLVEALFREADACDAIDCAQLVRFESQEQLENPVKVLDEVFKDRQCDIVHFSGHSIYIRGEKGEDDQGFVFLPGELGAIPVPIDKVASWFKDAKLVYMSSCQSADPGFVNTLADMGIPMIIGFRWQVSSLGASQFAGLFYRYLFHDRTGDIESAFVQAQRSMINKKKYPLPEELTDKKRYPITGKPGRKNIWEKPDIRAGVSPLLIMQNT